MVEGRHSIWNRRLRAHILNCKHEKRRGGKEGEEGRAGEGERKKEEERERDRQIDLPTTHHWGPSIHISMTMGSSHLTHHSKHSGL